MCVFFFHIKCDPHQYRFYISYLTDLNITMSWSITILYVYVYFYVLLALIIELHCRVVKLWLFCSSHRMSSRVMWVPSGMSVWVLYVCEVGRRMCHCGPPARPCDSWGPLRQLRPTARSDSLIMGGLPLWLPNTHCDTCTHTHIHTKHLSSGLLWPFSLGAVQPGRMGHPPFTWGLCFWFSLNGEYCSGREMGGVTISLASSAYLNCAAWMKNTGESIVLMGVFH